MALASQNESGCVLLKVFGDNKGDLTSQCLVEVTGGISRPFNDCLEVFDYSFTFLASSKFYSY